MKKQRIIVWWFFSLWNTVRNSATFSLWKTAHYNLMYIFGCEKQSGIQRHFLLVFRGENNIQTMIRCLCTEKMSVNFLLLFKSRKSSSNHRENTHHTMMRFFSTEKMLLNFLLIFRLQNNAFFFFRLRKCRWIFYCFSEPKMIIKLWCAVFPQKKCRWISCCFSESKIIIKPCYHDALFFFHRENVAEFLTDFQTPK